MPDITNLKPIPSSVNVPTTMTEEELKEYAKLVEERVKMMEEQMKQQITQTENLKNA